MLLLIFLLLFVVEWDRKEHGRKNGRRKMEETDKEKEETEQGMKIRKNNFLRIPWNLFIRTEED
jgi:hypothetical protein